MRISDVIHPGDKINISSLRSKSEEENDSSPSAIYRSMVLDVRTDDSIEIAMPSVGGGFVLLPMDEELQFEFLAKGGLYRAVGEVRERYKKDNIYMLRIVLATKLVKRQRREFFRYPCIFGITCFPITKEEALAESGEQVYERITKKLDQLRTEYTGMTLDLSGGGIRFLLSERMEPGEMLLLGIRLKSDTIDRQCYIIASVLSCVEKEDRKNSYEIRAQFQIQDNSVREEIVRYIFEEERRSRRRG